MAEGLPIISLHTASYSTDHSLVATQECDAGGQRHQRHFKIINAHLFEPNK